MRESDEAMSVHITTLDGFTARKTPGYFKIFMIPVAASSASHRKVMGEKTALILAVLTC